MSKFTTAIEAIKEEGLSGIIRIFGEKIIDLSTWRGFGNVRKKNDVRFLAKDVDIVECEWDTQPKVFSSPKKVGPYRFNWIISPPAKGSGGHQNIFRFIRFLEQAGHSCRVYFYSAHHWISLEQIEKNISSSYENIEAPIQWLDGEMEEADAIVATGWETAYPAYRSNLAAKRFYFVQDYEPLFYTMGSEYALAENTYKFGFTGITAGHWLSTKLHNDFGMRCGYYDFGVEHSLYKCENLNRRDKVFFYARPVTSRRGFELGLLALKKFYSMHPEIEIVMGGWDVDDIKIDFPYKNYAIQDVKELPFIYNQCAAALVLSFSNMSLLPLELLSCGTIPVMNKGLNNEMVAENDFILYSEPSPGALAAALSTAVTREGQHEWALKAAASVDSCSWSVSGDQFVSFIEREMRG